MRRALARGFAPAYAVALGAASGDALWAVATAAGAGLVLSRRGGAARAGRRSARRCSSRSLSSSSRARGAALPARATRAPAPGRFDSSRAGYVLGLGMALTSPWNVAFWLAVMGRPGAGAARPRRGARGRRRGGGGRAHLVPHPLRRRDARCACASRRRCGRSSRRARPGLLMLGFAVRGRSCNSRADERAERPRRSLGFPPQCCHIGALSRFRVRHRPVGWRRFRTVC